MKECYPVKDLLPLYIENMVSEETEEFINEHLSLCDSCRNELQKLKSDSPFDSSITPELTASEEIKPFKKIMKKLNRQIYGFFYLALIFFILLGFSFTAEEKMMYNSLIMPFVGILGYFVFRLQAIYKLPILLLIVNLFAFIFGIVSVDIYSAFIWTLIYMVFAIIGTAIAFLLHFAFGKEKSK